MTQPNSGDLLLRMLQLPRDAELDCETFLEHIAAYMDGTVESEELLGLMNHHRDLCAECAEEFAILERALSED